MATKVKKVASKASKAKPEKLTVAGVKEKLAAKDGPGEARRAFEATAGERAALAVEDVITKKLEYDEILGTYFVVLARILGLVPGIVTLRGLDLGSLLELRTLGLAAEYANAAWQDFTTRMPGIDDSLVAEGLALRTKLVDQVTMLQRWLPEEGIQMPEVGRSYATLPSDLRLLASTVKNHWAAVSDQTVLTASELKRAPGLASELVRHFGGRKMDGVLIQNREELADARDRAFTVLVRRYAVLRNGVRFERTGIGDADRIAPSLFLRTKRPKKGGKKAAKVAETSPKAETSSSTAVVVA